MTYILGKVIGEAGGCGGAELEIRRGYPTSAKHNDALQWQLDRQTNLLSLSVDSQNGN